MFYSCPRRSKTDRLQATISRTLDEHLGTFPAGVRPRLVLGCERIVAYQMKSSGPGDRNRMLMITSITNRLTSSMFIFSNLHRMYVVQSRSVRKSHS